LFLVKKAQTPAKAKKATRTLPQKKDARRYIEVMDTTLRDGEQTSGVSMTNEEKLLIAQRLLDRVGVDRIEITSCRVSEGERMAVKNIMRWARKNGYEDAVEVLSFTDYNKSVDWMLSVGCKRMNLLTKGSLKHCLGQLRKQPAEHLADIRKTLEYAVSKKVKTSIYLEDWSNGMLHSPDYVHFLMRHYVDMPFERILLPDTLGVLAPRQVGQFVEELVAKYGDKKQFEFHGHNDYGLAVANCLEAVRAGCVAVHCTVNGLGERAGNTSLEELIAALHDHTHFRTRVKESELVAASRMVELFSGKRIANNKPIVGGNVFTQTAGIHADGDKKGDLYASNLTPQRFGRDRLYALGKLSGRANLDFNLQRLGLTLTPEQHKAVLDRVIQLGDAKTHITTDDLPFLVSDVLERPEDRAFEVKNCLIVTSKGVKPIANIVVRYRDRTFEAQATGNGGYDAFMNALRSIKSPDFIPFKLPRLEDYEVHIPPGGKTDALVETTITWDNGLRTRGVDTDQVMAAVHATERLLNILCLTSANHAISPVKKRVATRKKAAAR